jgi:hypothetical protein
MPHKYCEVITCRQYFWKDRRFVGTHSKMILRPVSVPFGYSRASMANAPLRDSLSVIFGNKSMMIITKIGEESLIAAVGPVKLATGKDLGEHLYFLSHGDGWRTQKTSPRHSIVQRTEKLTINDRAAILTEISR